MLNVGIRDSGHEAPIIKAFIGLHHGISRATGGGTNVRSALLQHRSLPLLGTDHSVVCLSAPHRASFISAADRTVSTFCQLCLTFSTHSLLPLISRLHGDPLCCHGESSLIF